MRKSDYVFIAFMCGVLGIGVIGLILLFNALLKVDHPVLQQGCLVKLHMSEYEIMTDPIILGNSARVAIGMNGEKYGVLYYNTDGACDIDR